MHDVIDYVTDVKLTEKDGKKLVFCRIRKKELVLQPEELVRQAYVNYLVDGLGFSVMKIAVERGLKVNGLYRRFDIMVYDKKVEPLVLVECKSMYVELNQDVLEQVSHYNIGLKVPFLVVTNGKAQHVFRLNEEGDEYEEIQHLPSKKEVE